VAETFDSGQKKDRKGEDRTRSGRKKKGSCAGAAWQHGDGAWGEEWKRKVGKTGHSFVKKVVTSLFCVSLRGRTVDVGTGFGEGIR